MNLQNAESPTPARMIEPSSQPKQQSSESVSAKLASGNGQRLKLRTRPPIPTGNRRRVVDLKLAQEMASEFFAANDFFMVPTFVTPGQPLPPALNKWDLRKRLEIPLGGMRLGEFCVRYGQILHGNGPNDDWPQVVYMRRLIRAALYRIYKWLSKPVPRSARPHFGVIPKPPDDGWVDPVDRELFHRVRLIWWDLYDTFRRDAPHPPLPDDDDSFECEDPAGVAACVKIDALAAESTNGAVKTYHELLHHEWWVCPQKGEQWEQFLAAAHSLLWWLK
jgi:hypothetical protein